MSYDLIALVILVIYMAVSGDKCTLSVSSVSCEANVAANPKAEKPSY